MRQILSQLVISEATFQRLGPASIQAHPFSCMVPPATARPAVARAFGNLVLSQTMYIPFALYWMGRL